MTVIFKDTVPPIIEVAEFGYAAVAVYSLLYQSAYQDQRYDKRNCVKRRDCGGTTNWSHKGIANELHMGKQKVIECINQLLDNGFIQHEGFMTSAKGSKHRVYRVVHPTMLETVRTVMPMLPYKPSITAERNTTYAKGSSSHYIHDAITQEWYLSGYDLDLDQLDLDPRSTDTEL